MIMVFCIPAYAEETSETETVIYLTISNKGVFATDNDSMPMANKKLIVEDIDNDGKVTVDEALVAAHKAFNSEDGYSAPNGYVSKLWGVESTNNLFFVNDVGIPYGVAKDTVANGDRLVASINKDNVYYADWYTYFDETEKSVDVGEEFILSLNGFYGMAYTDEEKVSVPLNGISVGIWKDGAFDTIEDKVTDDEGKIILSFEEEGTYYITASGEVETATSDYNLWELNEGVYGGFDYSTFKSKVAYTEKDYGEGPYPPEEIKYVGIDEWKENKDNYYALLSNKVLAKCPIIAPVCVVTVINPETQIIHNIAKKYSKNGVSTDGNMQWFIADMAMYSELYPETEFVLSDAEKQLCIDKIIPEVKESTSANVLAKNIIALKAMGYDPRELYTAENEKVDAVARLTDLVDAKDAAVTNVYTLSYVIMALNQGDYMTSEQENFLLTTAVGSKSSWQDTKYGPDAASPMVVALRPYYNETNADIKALIDETMPIISGCMDETGLVSKNAASTGLAIAAFSAVGTDVKTVVKGEVNLIDGLMTKAAENLDGFESMKNSFSTEQGFRGLLGRQLLVQGKNKTIYDFSQNSVKPAYATAKDDDEDQGDGEGNGEDTNTVSVKIRVMVHDENKCNNSYTYRKNSDKYTALVNETLKVQKGSSVFDVLKEALDKAEIDFTESSYGYISEINGLAEFDHGSNSGWMFTVGGKHMTTGCKDTYLNSGSTVVWFYTDDYSSEKGSESFSSSGGSSGGTSRYTVKFQSNGGTTVNSLTVARNSVITEPDMPQKEGYIFEGWFSDAELTKEYDFSQKVEKSFTLYAKWSEEQQKRENPFTDVDEDDWFFEAVEYVYINGLMNGTDKETFAPDESLTRAMLVTILYRLEDSPVVSENIPFKDVDINSYYGQAAIWAYNNGIINGYSETEFRPDENIINEHTELIINRYADLKNKENVILNNHNSTSTRAEIAEIIFKKLKK